MWSDSRQTAVCYKIVAILIRHRVIYPERLITAVPQIYRSKLIFWEETEDCVRAAIRKQTPFSALRGGCRLSTPGLPSFQVPLRSRQNPRASTFVSCAPHSWYRASQAYPQERRGGRTRPSAAIPERKPNERGAVFVRKRNHVVAERARSIQVEGSGTTVRRPVGASNSTGTLPVSKFKKVPVWPPVMSKSW